MRNISRWILGAALSVGAAACARSATVTSTEAGDLAPAMASSTVHVANHNLQDIDVFVVANGVSTRLGTVTTNSSSDFTISPAQMTQGRISLVASPIGALGAARSGALQVHGGETINFTVEQDLHTSSATVQN